PHQAGLLSGRRPRGGMVWSERTYGFSSGTFVPPEMAARPPRILQRSAAPLAAILLAILHTSRMWASRNVSREEPPPDTGAGWGLMAHRASFWSSAIPRAASAGVASAS